MEENAVITCLSKTKVFNMVLVLITSLLITVTPIVGVVERVQSPRLDEIFFKVITDQYDATEAFQNGEIDVFPGITQWACVQSLIEGGATVTNDIGFQICYIGINCRDYTPDEPSPDPYRPNHSPLAPLNDTAFRQALAYCFGHNEKAIAINLSYGGPVVAPLDTFVPPSLAYWHNPNVTIYETDYALANETLYDVGYYVNMTDNKLYGPDNKPLRDEIEFLRLSWLPSGIDYYAIDSWNNFFGNYLGVTNCQVVWTTINLNQLRERVFIYRDFDLYLLCWGIDRNPAWLYEYFHSSQDSPGLYNSPGLCIPELDSALETIKYGLNLTEIKEACNLAQEILQEQVPCITAYSRYCINAFNPDLRNVISSPGYGSDNMWTWRLIHWNNSSTGSNVTSVLTSPIAKLSPCYASYPSEWEILNMLFDPLIEVNPFTHEDMPWMACNWSVEQGSWPVIGIENGLRFAFQLRQGAHWHDGMPVTVEDVKFAWDYIKTHKFSEFSSMWRNYYCVEHDACQTVWVYLNATSRWLLYEFAKTALMFPRHIWENADPTAFKPWEISYQDWTGIPPPTQYPFMKALVGSGPYVFDYWNSLNGTAHVVKFTDYWVNSPIKQNLIAPQRVNPSEQFTYYVELINTGSKDEITGELAPTVIDSINITADGETILTIPGPITIEPFEHLIFGPFTYMFATAGYHYLECHAYAYSQIIDYYEHSMKVTIREDLCLDFAVNFLDAIILGSVFGSRLGESNWDFRADIKRDFAINFLDAILLGNVFNWPK